MQVTRRDFLRLGTGIAALWGMEATALPRIVEALDSMAKGAAPVLWLQGQSCSGCSVSLLNSEQPDAAQILTQYISLGFHSTLSAATGHRALDAIDTMVDEGGYYLVVEGSIPMGMPEACTFGEEPLERRIEAAARRAEAVIAVGNCATHGGIPGAENNPTGAVSMPDFMKERSLNKPVIRLPGCPAHPDWVVGTLVHVLRFGLPDLDEEARPKAFFRRLVHDQCPRFADYERERFAKTFGDEGCLFRLGCLGPLTHADCTLRQWNGGINTCIRAGAPCIGCASESFAHRADFPFYRKTEENSEH